MNGLFYLAFYQLCEIFQDGVPCWDAGTTYYKGSIVQDTSGLGVLYHSLTDTNLNNAVTDSTNWGVLSAPSSITPLTGGGTNRTLTAADNGAIFEVDDSANTQGFVLPGTIPNFRFTVVDATGFFYKNNCSIVQAATETIQGLAATMKLKAPFGKWTFQCNASGNWNLVA